MPAHRTGLPGWGMRWQSRIKYLLDWFTPRPISEMLHLSYDHLALQRLRPLLGDYLPWTGSALRPAAIELICNEIIVHQRRRVLECGSGISTVVIGQLVSNLGGTLTSLEDDPTWASFVGTLSARIGRAVKIVHSPLIDTPHGHWYDLRNLNTVLTNDQEKGFDLLIVDGPVASSSRLARYPALPLLRSKLADDYAVVLDDVRRRAERLTVDAWVRQFSLSERIYLNRAGVAILRPQSSKAYYNIA